MLTYRLVTRLLLSIFLGAPHLFSAQFSEIYREITGPTGANTSLFYLNDNSLSVTIGQDANLKFWKTLNGEQICGFKKVVAWAVNKNRDALAFAASDGTIRVLDARSLVVTTLADNQYGVLSLDVSADGQIVLAVTLGGSLKVWHVDGGKTSLSIKAHHKINGARFDDRGNFIIANLSNNTRACYGACNGAFLLDTATDGSAQSENKVEDKARLYHTTAIQFLMSAQGKSYEEFLRFWAATYGYTVAFARHKERGAFKHLPEPSKDFYREVMSGLPKEFAWKHAQE